MLSGLAGLPCRYNGRSIIQASVNWNWEGREFEHRVTVNSRESSNRFVIGRRFEEMFGIRQIPYVPNTGQRHGSLPYPGTPKNFPNFRTVVLGSCPVYFPCNLSPVLRFRATFFSDLFASGTLWPPVNPRCALFLENRMEKCVHSTARGRKRSAR